MNTRLLIDEVLTELAGFIATLATLNGARTLVADLPDRFFYRLATALEAQGLSKKLVADMSGLALRSYQKRLQRLAESRSDTGKTLWEAVFVYLHQRRVVPRGDLERRFAHDDPQVLGSVLHDLVESGLVFRTGSGPATLYRAADERDLAVSDPAGDGAEALIWLTIYRDGPIGLEALAARHRGLAPETLEQHLEHLMADGRVTRDGDRYLSRSLVMSAGGREGPTAAVADHLRAVFTTLSQALTRAPDDPRRGYTGGSTYTFDVSPADRDDAAGTELAAEVEALLPRLRAQLTALRERADAHFSPDSRRVVVYCGVTELNPEAPPAPSQPLPKEMPDAP
jgi:hypothetical protein